MISDWPFIFKFVENLFGLILNPDHKLFLPNGVVRLQFWDLVVGLSVSEFVLDVLVSLLCQEKLLVDF